MTVVAASYGAGVQSTAMLVLAAQRKIEPRLFIFADVGDDSEHPASLAYHRDVATPYAAAHGVEMVTVRNIAMRGGRAGEARTVRGELKRGRRIIPIRRSPDGPPMSRSCTADFKIAPIGRELKRRGASKDDPARVSLGISVDEIERAKPGIDPRSPHQFRTYPLLDHGLTRADCLAVIRDAGLPEPAKSSCYFCPFHSDEAWRLLARNTPDLFAEACKIEAEMSATATDGRPVFLTRKGVPLADAIDTDQGSFAGLDGCDSGWCMT